jgi:hypothetical protein
MLAAELGLILARDALGASFRFVQPDLCLGGILAFTNTGTTLALHVQPASPSNKEVASGVPLLNRRTRYWLGDAVANLAI